MKTLKIRLKNCCHCVPLRVGCLMNALILIFFELIAVPQRDPGSQLYLKGILVVTYRLLNIFHSIGCLLLFVSTYARFCTLVRIFLATAGLHIIVTPGFLILELLSWGSSPYDVGIAFFGIVLSIYFWLVAHSYYHQCKNEKFVLHATFADDVEPRHGAATFA